MYSRLLSVFGLLVFVFLASNLAYGQANTKEGYNFSAAQTNYYAAGPAARDLTACQSGQSGKAVPPNDAAVGEKLCDVEATRRGIPVAHMKWIGSPPYGSWGSPGDNYLCKVVNGSLKYVQGAGSAWTNVVICKYEPFDCGDRWSYQLDAGSGANVNNWQLNWTKTRDKNDFANVNGTRFVCLPRTCTAATCPDTPAAGRDECFLTDKPGEYRRLNGALCACPASKEKVGNNCVAKSVTPPVTPPTTAQCADGIDNDGDGKIDFVCPAGGSNYRPEQSKGRESATFTAAQGIFEEMAPSGQAKRPSLISSKVDPGDKVKVVSVSNNKFSISVGKKNADRTCDYGTLSFVNANERTLETRQLRNINNNGIIAPPGTNRAFVSFDDNPQQYSDNSGYNGNNGYNPCQVTIEVFSPAVGTPGAATTCTPDPDCTSATDNSEAPDTLAQCSDGIDNDGDGKIDYAVQTDSKGDTTLETLSSQGASTFVSILASKGITYDVSKRREYQSWSIPGSTNVNIEFMDANLNHSSVLAYYNSANQLQGIFRTGSGAPSNDSQYAGLPLLNKGQNRTITLQGSNIRFAEISHERTSSTDNSQNDSNKDRAVVYEVEPNDYIIGFEHGADSDYDDLIIRVKFPPADPDCTSATDDTESGDLVCPAGQTRRPTPSSPVCFLTVTPTTSPAGTAFSLTGYSHLTGTCTLGSTTAHNTPTTPILPTAPSSTLSVSSTGALTMNATTTGSFATATTAQVASLLTCPQGSAVCSIGTGGVISCGCYNTGIIPPTIITAAEYTCASNLCAEGQYFCSAESICKPAGQPCSAITCDQDNVCEVGESCNCGDCTQGNLLNDKDQCGVGTGGEQLYCTKDSVVASNTTFPFCLPACLDGQACTTTCKQQVGACCPAGSQWNSTANSCVPMTCGKGEFYCAAQKKCLPGGTTCDTAVCVNDGTCSGEESCQCADCVNGGSDDKDKCSIIGGIQAMCSDDNLTDGKPGACCVPPEKWDSTANGGAGACLACSNTQAPAELKANYDQPYITCTGNGVVADTHFRYMIKQGTTVVMTSDIYPNSTQVLHPKMAAGTYTVQCFYGNATTVNTTGTATPHTCEKTMTVKTDNENAVQGCNRVYAYKGSTLSDELTSNTGFDASFRCGARLTSVDTPNPFALHIGTIAPQFLIADTFMTSFLGEFNPPIGALSTQTQNHRFNTGSTPIACAVRVGGGYSTNDYCRATACVGDNCNVPQAFSVVHSGDAVCTTAQTDTYNIGCNPEAPDDIRTQCVEMFQSAVTAAGAGAANGAPFTFSFSFNGTPRSIECAKYAAGSSELKNIYDTVSCKATLANGEYYDIYAADLNGNKINSLQTQTRTVQRDDSDPKLDPIKYYTDSSLTTEMTPGIWSSKPVTAVAICRDAPTTESASCACAPLVHDSTTDKSEWTRGVYHGTVDIGADLLRYTRTISTNLTGTQMVKVVDTAGRLSNEQTLSVSLDTEAPVVTPTSPSTGSTRDVTLTATDDVSKIWKTTIAPATGGATNTQGIIWRKGLKANLSSLTFDEECGVTPSFATVSDTDAASFPKTATVTIPALNMTTEVITYCIRDNAGNTTRGIYPVVTDACFSATNMSPIPTFGNYKTLTNTRLGGSGTDNQKYGYSFSENTSNAACFRGILATNIQTFVANQLEPRTTTTLTNWDTDRAPTKANTSVLNTNGYYYYKYSGNTLNLTTSPTGTGNKSVIVDGGDIHIKENINYSGPGKTLLLIARRNVTGQGGNIIIDTTVTNIDAILIADGGALKSSNASAPGERLIINGRIYSYNTRGGSLERSGTSDVINANNPRIFTPNGTLAAAPSLADAQVQDLERFRPSFVGESQCSLHLNYYAYTTATLPLLLQKPVGYTGGNCGF